jgi:hypothetical protein
MNDRPRLPALACLVATVLAPAAVRAQEAGSGAENITPGVSNPERYLYESGVCPSCAATDVTNSPRAQNLNPEGINFADCEQNLRMDFTLVLSGFSAIDDALVEVWAGTVDCTQPINRVLDEGVAHPCWQVAEPYGPVTATASQTITKSIYARDVLRYEQPPSDPTALQTYSPSFNSAAQGESACHVQPTDAAVPLGIYFVAVDSNGNTLGTAYEYSLTADLVAPPPPSVSALQPGDTLLTVDWTSPGSDPDITGFAVYSDPPSSTSTTASGCGCGQAPGSAASSYVAQEAGAEDSGSVSVCEDAGTTSLDGAAGTTKCSPVNQGGSSGSTGCASENLEGHSFVMGGTTTPAVADAGDAGDSGVALAGAGISEINPTYLAGEIDSNTATSQQLTGLTNGTKYKVGVASLDGSGNVGPLSPLVCGTAGAVNDFWQNYKDDGGSSGGCALDAAGANLGVGSVFGLGLLASAAALVRRRRRSR